MSCLTAPPLVCLRSVSGIQRQINRDFLPTLTHGFVSPSIGSWPTSPAFSPSHGRSKSPLLAASWWEGWGGLNKHTARPEKEQCSTTNYVPHFVHTTALRSPIDRDGAKEYILLAYHNQFKKGPLNRWVKES